MTRWLLGEEIVRVSVLAPAPSSLARPGLQDPQLLLLQTASGRLVDVEAFVTAGYGYDVRCEVVGEAGTLELLAPATIAIRAADLDALTLPVGFEQRFEEAYRQELQAWITAIAARGELPGPSAWDGYAAAAVCEAAVASLESGGTPVDVRLSADA